MAVREGPERIRWTAGPLLAWLAVFLSSLVGLLILAYVWTTGSPPWPTSSGAPAFLPELSLEVALIVPAVLVLLGTFLATRVLHLRAPPPAEWSTPGSAAPEPSD
jgi:hypothetical protein